MCAGQGRDLIGPLAAHPRRDDVHALLVELDADNAKVATRSAQAAGLTGVQVVVADAADPSIYHPVAPVDLAMVCGVFGNIGDEDIRRTGYLPVLLRPRRPRHLDAAPGRAGRHADDPRLVLPVRLCRGRLRLRGRPALQRRYRRPRGWGRGPA
jgi:hypothetical protein